MSKSKVASIRALQELLGIVVERRSKKYTPIISDIKREIQKSKDEVTTEITKQIEAYAVEKYTQYGLSVIPVCHRSSSYRDEDSVRAELRVKVYPQNGLQEKLSKAEKEEQDAIKATDEWYFRAVQAVAEQAELPATPEF